MTAKKRGTGRFIVLIGPDGVGKTTAARAIIDCYAGPTGYFHFLPPLRGSLPTAPPSVDTPMPKPPREGFRPLGWLRLLRMLVLIRYSYAVTVRPALARGTLVVADRWAYGYLGQPHALRYYGPEWLARLALWTLPKPNLIVNLVAPPSVIARRKPELTLGEVTREMEVWESIEPAISCTVSTLPAPEAVAKEVMARLGEPSDRYQRSLGA